MFFFYYPCTTYIYTLSLHDALPISTANQWLRNSDLYEPRRMRNSPTNPLSPGRPMDESETIKSAIARSGITFARPPKRSEEHTSELQSLRHLVCRLLLEKKKKI